MSAQEGKILVVCDLSNFCYASIFSAVAKWQEKSDYASILKPAEETDQDDLPNLIAYPDFKKILHKNVQSRLETLDWIVRSNHQDAIDAAPGLDFVFTVDDKLSDNFRKLKVPSYKAQRKLVKRQYDVYAIKNYIQDVILPELDLENSGYAMVKVDGCESDDIIAVMMERLKGYSLRILISSDHDFLQLKDVVQYDLGGKPVKRVVRGDDQELNETDFLLWKIIRGDISDNIPSCFERYGDKKSLGLVRDRTKLRKMLKESADARRQFETNKFLIDFRSIPVDLADKIYAEVQKKLAYNNMRTLEKTPDFGSQMIDLDSL